MCGITGFLDPDGVLTEQDLRRMNASITRRGPDGEGYFVEGGIGLAMRRLAIIDISGGWQPVYNEDRSIVVVFNGEIYNYRELREELLAAGHTFRTHGDSETIAHLYEVHGEAFTSRLRGMFAIALWDRKLGKLVLARDRLGIKPLYVAKVGRGIVFGSEIKTLLASGRVGTELDWSAVDQYFTYTFIPAPLSIYRDIRKFPAGSQASHYLDGRSSSHSYWSLPPHRIAAASDLEIEHAVEDALLGAVKSHMVSDVPVGAFLSGGIDSSLIVAMMTRFSSTPVKTFTVGFNAAGGGFLDERGYAREVAARYGLEHHEIEVNPDARGILPEIISAFDEPFADDSVIPSYYVSQAAAREVKVAMTGLGGDELFGGYRRHLGMNLGRFYRRLPGPLRRSIFEPLVNQLPETSRWGDIADHLKRFMRAGDADASRQYQDYLSTQAWAKRRSLYLPHVQSEMDAQATEAVATDIFRGADTESELEKALRTDLALYLPDDILTLTDRLSMWHSLELRVPFLDHGFVEICSRLAPRHKVAGLTQKKILRSIARRWVPASILNHRKQGFEAPMGSWLRGPLLPLLDELASDSNLRSLGIFDGAEVRRLRDEHVSGKRKNSKLLFSMLVFMQWARQNNIHPGS